MRHIRWQPRNPKARSKAWKEESERSRLRSLQRAAKKLDEYFAAHPTHLGKTAGA